MGDYQPLDLYSFCNVGVDFFSDGVRPALGSQQFHGLPFLIGSSALDPSHCFIGFGGANGTNEPVTLPVNATAHTLIFAHSQAESRILEGGHIGRVIATYVVQYADGDEVRVPIRERFEIGVVPQMWGQSPFLAVPDIKSWQMPRYKGEWRGIGYRQAEVIQAWPKAYFLWAWHNPQPERPIQSLTIEPGELAFVLAGITLGYRDEHPFVRTGRREVKITLLNEQDAAKPFDLAVEVDRGVATYPFALPTNAETFLDDLLKGWGEPQNELSSPAYVEVAAISSATVTVKNGDEELGQAVWGALEAEGAVETPRTRIELVDRGRNWVRVTVVEDATDQPVPCRVHFRSPEGIPYQPHGHHNHVNSNIESWHSDIGGDVRLGQISYAYIDGNCEGWLPRGDVLVDVARGFEYEPLREKITIAPGQQELTLRIKRWTDMNAQGWFSGDSHVHFLGEKGAHLEARGEDLNVVNLLQSQWGHLFTNIEDWSGSPSISNSGNTIVYCSQENRQHTLGHLIMWGLKQPVMPWGTGGPGEAELGGTLEETMSGWADATHRQGGTVVLPHLPAPNGEPAALIATGRADAVEMLTHTSYSHLEYYRYLNGGYRLPLVGGTDKMSSDVPVGLYRTYAYIPNDQPFTYENWCAAVRAGRTFLSGGPIIRLSVEGMQIGDTVHLSAGGGTVELEATAESIFPIHTLEIVQEGRVVATTEDQVGSRRLTLKTRLRIDGHTWLAARCGGPNGVPLKHCDNWERGIFAHTSPIYVAVGEPWSMFSLDTAQYMLTLIDGGLSHIRHSAAYYPPGSVSHHHGHHDHQAYLEEPFLQAQEAIHRRMHQLGIPH